MDIRGSRITLSTSAVNAIVITTPNTWVSTAINASAPTTVNGVADRLEFVPFMPNRTITIDRLQFSVTTAVAGSSVKVAVYSSNSFGRPSVLLAGSASLSGEAVATLFHALSPTLILQAGVLYFVAVHWSSTTALRAIPLAGCLPIFAGISVFNTVLRVAHPYANGLPAIAPSTGVQSADAPKVDMRISA